MTRPYNGRCAPRGPRFPTKDRRIGKPISARTNATVAGLTRGGSSTKRLPRQDEIEAMHSALDRLLVDEREMREHGRNCEHPALYHAEAVAIMDLVVEGSAVDPDAMFRVLDLLDQFHRSVEALDIGRNAHNRARRELRDMATES